MLQQMPCLQLTPNLAAKMFNFTLDATWQSSHSRTVLQIEITYICLCCCTTSNPKNLNTVKCTFKKECNNLQIT